MQFRFFIFTLLCLFFQFSPALATDLLLENVEIIDPATQRSFQGHVLISNEKIQSVSAMRPTNYSGPSIDLRGKWIMPGLIDMHTHSYGNAGPGGAIQFTGIEVASKLMLYSGVTAFLDLFSPEDEIFSIRDRQRREGLEGSEIFAAGPIFTCTKGHGTEYGVPTRIVDTPADAHREITTLAAKKPDVIKIVYDHARVFPSIDKATMEMAVKTANQLSLKTVIHIGTWQDAAEARV